MAASKKKSLAKTVDSAIDESFAQQLSNLYSKLLSIKSGENLLQTMTRGIADFLQPDYVYIGEYVESYKQLSSLMFYHKKRLLDNRSFSSEHMALEKSVKENIYRVCLKDARQRYPEAEFLRDYSIEAFLAWPLKGTYDQTIGFLILMYCKPLKNGRNLGAQANISLESLHDLIQPINCSIAYAIEQEQLHRNLLKMAGAVDAELEKSNKELKYTNEVLKDRLSLLHKFVPVQFLKLLGVKESEAEVTLGRGREIILTVMFTDIRDFARITEDAHSAQEVFEFMNEYIGYTGPPIRSHHGFIDKFIGDGIMAIFSNPEDALDAADDMLKGLKQFNIKRSDANAPPVSAGIGIHTGSMMIGTQGLADRIQTTVIGDAVNIASRIEELSRDYDADVIVSKDLVDALKDPSKYHFTYLVQTQLKGRQQFTDTYKYISKENTITREPSLSENKEIDH